MPCFPVPKCMPGCKARPRAGNDAYADRVGGGRVYGKAESESWQVKNKATTEIFLDAMHGGGEE